MCTVNRVIAFNELDYNRQVNSRKASSVTSALIEHLMHRPPAAEVDA